ncbi:MAG TPA: methyltransferase domain-containing protein [Prolixibacteraceae bacterium]|nr:methyltransferase domain-containing protein [Prolixibacteraceae bacterium]
MTEKGVTIRVIKTENLIQFACPKCKQDVQLADTKYFCNDCKRSYPIIKNIPDFISLDPDEKRTNITRIAKAMDSIAPIYESKIWYQFLLNLSGTRNTSLNSIANFYSETFKNTNGYILDVACGPATFGRRIASSNKIVCGIDISIGALQRGMKNIVKDGVSNVYLTRSRVEELPFINSLFDGVISNGSLHLFPNTLHALQEISGQ